MLRLCKTNYGSRSRFKTQNIVVLKPVWLKVYRHEGFCGFRKLMIVFVLQPILAKCLH